MEIQYTVNQAHIRRLGGRHTIKIEGELATSSEVTDNVVFLEVWDSDNPLEVKYIIPIGMTDAINLGHELVNLNPAASD